jgi:hypothetical protein
MSLEALGRWSEGLRIPVVRIAPSEEEVASRVAAAFHRTADPTRLPEGSVPAVYAQRDLSGRLLLRLAGRAARPRRMSLHLVVILLARHGPPATTIAGLLDCDSATIRR